MNPMVRKWCASVVGLAMMLSAALGFSLATSTMVSATTPSWTGSWALNPADSTGLVNGDANAISCPSAGNCVAVGVSHSTLGSGSWTLLIDEETNGVWANIAAPLPNDAAPYSAGSVGNQLSDVTCVSAGNCVAVGTYKLANAGNSYAPLILEEVNGQWSSATTTLPSDAVNGYWDELTSVTCTAIGSCIAVGFYYNGGTANEAFITQEINSVWGAISPTPLPSNASPAFGNNDSFSSVTCGSEICAAVGRYWDPTTSNTGWLIDGTDLTNPWVNVPSSLPADAVTGNGSQPDTGLASVSCPAVGTCVAVGTYKSSSGSKAAVVSGDVITFPAGTTAPLPPDAATGTGPGDFVSDLQSVVCSSSTNCTAVGSYLNGAGKILPLIDIETNGQWAAVVAPVPSDSVSGQPAFLSGIACTSFGNCVATGGYANAAGNLSLIDVESNGVWTNQAVILPSGAGPGIGQDETDGSTIYAPVSCPSQGTCVGIGYAYSTTFSETRPMIVTESVAVTPAAPVVVTTSTLAATGFNLVGAGVLGAMATVVGVGCLWVVRYRRDDQLSTSTNEA